MRPRSSLRAAAALVALLAALPAWAQAPATLVKSLGPARPRAEYLGSSVAFGAEIVFGAAELWKTDGTDVGTVMVKDINPTGSSNPSGFRRSPRGPRSGRPTELPRVRVS